MRILDLVEEFLEFIGMLELVKHEIISGLNNVEPEAHNSEQHKTISTRFIVTLIVYELNIH